MSLDETSLAVWELRAHPVAALIADRGAGVLLEKIPAAVRPPFEEARSALAGWYPARAVPLLEVYTTSVVECWAAHERMDDATAKEPAVIALLHGLHVQLAVLDRHSAQRRTLPSDCYQIDEAQLIEHVGELVRLERHLERRQMEKRMNVLLEVASARGVKWPAVRAAAERQGWGRLRGSLAKLGPRTRELAEAIDLGATVERADIGGRAALRVTFVDGSRRVAALDDAERAALFAVVPWAEPASI
jgi:hypothetical protein